MRIAIMQPTYLPWCGYFDLVDQVDFFVFLDDVAFQKRSWQQRNRIVREDGLSWLTLPTKNKGLRGERIWDVEIADVRVLAKHAKTLASVYKKTPYCEALLWEYELIAKSAGTSLSMLNVGLIEAMGRALDIRTPWALSSELGLAGHRGGHLARLCQSLRATEYITPPGSVEYLREDAASFFSRGIAISIHQYEHPVLGQGRPEFCSHASAIDLLARKGPEAGDVVRSGRRACKPLIPAFSDSEFFEASA